MNKLPAAIGPYATYRKTKTSLITSGQLPVDPETNEFVSEDIKEQTEQVLKNIATILRIEHLEFKDIVKTTVYLKDMNDFAAMNEVYATFFNEPYPARSAFQVGQLPKDARVEIECVVEL